MKVMQGWRGDVVVRMWDGRTLTPKSQFQPSNVLLVEVPPQFIALCEASGASPQAALRGMAAMLCGLRYDADNRLVPLDGPTA